MESEIAQWVGKLIEKLKVNDEKRADEYEEPPKEPRETMDALVKIGGPAVEPLLELLKDTSKYSCLYAIKVLGEIRDPMAVHPLIDILDTLDSEDHPQVWEALQKIGHPALDPTLNYLKKARDAHDTEGMYNALEILAGIKNEKSFRALVDMLSHSNDEVQATAVIELGEYGDKRAVEHLKKLLERTDAREFVAEVIRKLVSHKEYRDIIAPYPSNLESYRHKIDGCLKDIEYAHTYTKKFEGDEADKVGIFLREHKVLTAFATLLREVANLGLQETAISDKLKEELDVYIGKIEDEISKLSEQYGVTPEITRQIASGYYPISLKTEEKTYKNFRENREQYIAGTNEWLRGRGFRIIVQDHWLVWAWREEPKGLKGIVATFDDSVTIRLWGRAWTDEEANSFPPQFWQFVEKLDFELLRIPRTRRVYSWERWREILTGRGLDTEIIRSIEKTLVYCYVSSLMGRQSIPPSIISHLELLSDPEIGLIYVSRCKDDPFSDHKAKTCHVKLTHLTDAGLSIAKEIHLRTLDKRVEEIIEALSNLPERKKGLVKYFIGKRVLSGETGPWDLTAPHFHVAKLGYFPPCFRSHSEEKTILPAEVHESIDFVKDKLLSQCLATPSWRHTVSGFTEDILSVCPETLQRLSKEMGGYELDSYLLSCQRFIEFLKAKLDLLLGLTPYGDGYGGMITNRDVRRFAEGFGIPEPVILDWLRELHDKYPDLISEIKDEAMEITEDATVCHIAEGDRYKLGGNFTIISYPKLVEMLKAETVEEAYLEVLENVKEWFATGEKRPFTTYLKIERSLRHPLNFSSCAHLKDRT